MASSGSGDLVAWNGTYNITIHFSWTRNNSGVVSWTAVIPKIDDSWSPCWTSFYIRGGKGVSASGNLTGDLTSYCSSCSQCATYYQGRILWDQTQTGTINMGSDGGTLRLGFYGQRNGSNTEENYLTWGVDPPPTAPSGLSVSIAEVYPTGAKFNVAVSSYGSPSSASGRYIEAAILNQNTYGATYKYATAQNTSSSAITVNNNVSGGTLTVQPNTQYYYGAYADNTQLHTSVVQGQFVTLAPTPTVSVGTISGNSATINYSTAADGGYYNKTIEYSLDGGTTWQTGATVTGGSAQSGTFTISNLPGGENSVLVRTTTTAGSDEPTTLTISIPINATFYGSITKIASIGAYNIASSVKTAYTQPSVSSVDLTTLKNYLNNTLTSLAPKLNAGNTIAGIEVVIEKQDAHTWEGRVYVCKDNTGTSLTYTTKSADTRSEIVTWLAAMGFTATSDSYSDASFVALSSIQYQSTSKEVKKLYGSVEMLSGFTERIVDSNSVIASFTKSTFISKLRADYPNFATKDFIANKRIRVYVYILAGTTYIQMFLQDITTLDMEVVTTTTSATESYGFTFNSGVANGQIAYVYMDDKTYTNRSKKILKLYGSVNGKTKLCFSDGS